MSGKQNPLSGGRLVQGEIVFDATRSAPQKSLDAANDNLDNSVGLRGLFTRKETRAAAQDLQRLETKVAVEIGIQLVEKEADSIILSKKNSGDLRRATILDATNEQLGILKRRSTESAGKAIQDEIRANGSRQQALQQADVLEDDRNMVAHFLHQYSRDQILHVASQHGVEIAEDEGAAE